MRLDRIDTSNIGNAQEKFDEKVKGLTLQVLQQAQAAKPTRQIRMLFQEHDDLYKQAHAGTITPQEFKKVEKLIFDEMGATKVHTFSEFFMLLIALGISEDAARGMATHENDHVQKALQIGLDAEYALVHSRSSDGKLILHPFMMWEVPVGHDQALIRKVEELVISAPENLSKDDINKLRELKEK